MVRQKLGAFSEVKIKSGKVELAGFLQIPPDAKGIVLFVHGSGSTRHSPRNQMVARFLNEGNCATLLFDLLTAQEEELDNITYELRFNIPLLAERLVGATEWVQKHAEASHLTIGYFGSSTGAAAALIGAAEMGEPIKAVVSRGGRPDLAGKALLRVKSPTLLIVGGNDFGVIELNQQALDLITAPKKLEIVPGATHLFQEPGTLEEVGRMATLWFQQYL